MVHEDTHLVATSTHLENKMTYAKRLGPGDAFIGETEARDLGGLSTGWVR